MMWQISRSESVVMVGTFLHKFSF